MAAKRGRKTNKNKGGSKSKTGKKQGEATSEEYGPGFYSEIGKGDKKKGGDEDAGGMDDYY